MSCLGCQHFISDWLGKLKPNKLSTGCQNELKGAAVEKATNPGRRFLFLAASPLVLTRFAREFRGNRHATQAIDLLSILSLDSILYHVMYSPRPFLNAALTLAIFHWSGGLQASALCLNKLARDGAIDIPAYFK